MPRARVIVIDDDPLFRSLLASMLRAQYAVSVAADGAEGYYKALQLPPHLAIVDVQMPGWDGLRTLKAFRTNYVLAEVPVMIMTSDASRETVLAALEEGASDYVIKTTLSRDEFLKKVTDLVESALHRRKIANRRPPSDAPSPGLFGNDPDGDTSLATLPLTEDALLQSIVENWD